MDQVELPHMTFACLASDKREQGSVALVMTTGKHVLIPKSAPIHSTSTALHEAVHMAALSETVLSTAVPTISQTAAGAPCRLWGYLSKLWSVLQTVLATYYYLISNIFPRD